MNALNHLKKRIIHIVCMLATLATHKSFLSKTTASQDVSFVTLIILPFKNDNCDQYHLLLQLICALFNIFLIMY